MSRPDAAPSPAAGGPDPAAAWADYLRAAQRLDAVRRRAAGAAAEHDRGLAGAREELAGAAARLSPQRIRLREAGAPDDRLTPTPEELAAADRAVAGPPAAVLAALRQARATADAADAALLGGRFGGGPGGSRAPLRNLLVYGPFALAVLVVQVALYLLVDGAPLPVYAACGLAMPLLAFGLAWAVIGAVFPAGPAGRVDRTWQVGLLVCFAPVLITCLGTGALALLR